MDYCKYIANINFPDKLILEQKPCTKTRSNSPNILCLYRLTNMWAQLALLCHGKTINRFKLLLQAIFTNTMYTKNYIAFLI